MSQGHLRTVLTWVVNSRHIKILLGIFSTVLLLSEPHAQLYDICLGVILGRHNSGHARTYTVEGRLTAGSVGRLGKLCCLSKDVRNEPAKNKDIECQSRLTKLTYLII